ncbi:MAG: hypothetical protein ACM3ON_08905 [Chloroflexota bacterium]
MKINSASLLFVGVLVCAAFAVHSVTAAQAAKSVLKTGEAMGTLSIDGKTIELKHAYAMAQPNTFEKEKTDIAVLLTQHALPEGALKDLEDLGDVTQGLKGFVYFKIQDQSKPVYEMIDHPALGDTRLMMSGFTHASFTAESLSKDLIEGSFKTDKPEQFIDHRYELQVRFSTSIAQAKRPEPLPNATTGTKLPADGGEPGKTYLRYHKALLNKDIATVRKVAPEPDAPMTEEQMRKAIEFMAELTPKDTAITEGYVQGDRAVLYLTGTFDGEKNYGTVEMIRKGGAWKIKKEMWSNTPPEK